MFTLRNTALAILLATALPAANSAVQTYTLSGNFDSGTYAGESYAGSFSFDDAGLTGNGSEWLSVSSLSFTLLGNSWTQADAIAPVEVGFQDGALLGLSYSANGAAIGVSFVPGFFDASEAFVAYSPAVGFDGAGSVIYAPVPETGSWAMLLAGFGLLGVVARKTSR